MKNIYSNGSYLLIRPMNEEGGITEGEVYIKNLNKEFNKGEIVYYLEEDSKHVSLDGVELDAIFYYQILYRIDKIVPEIPYDKDYTSKHAFQFQGLEM